MSRAHIRDHIRRMQLDPHYFNASLTEANARLRLLHWDRVIAPQWQAVSDAIGTVE